MQRMLLSFVILEISLPETITTKTTIMKKICSRVLLRSGLLAVCAGFVMIACSKEETPGSWDTDDLGEENLVEDEPQLPEEKWVDATLSSAIRQDADGETKTQMGGDSGRSVLWSDDDEIGIFDTRYKGAGSRFSKARAGMDEKSRVFGGRIREFTSSFFSVYPYQEGASLNGTVLTMQIPTHQEAVNGSFATGAALAFASGAFNEERGTDGSVTFTNLCAILCFKMPAYIDGAKSVVVRAKSGAAIAGTVTIDCTRSVITSVSGSSSVTVSSDAMAASGAYYVAIAPGTYENGFSFTVTTAGGSSYMAQTTKTLPAEAGVIYNLGTVNLNLNTAPTVTIVHQYNASGELSGSTASLDIPQVSKELENLITAWEATLSKNGTVCRRLNRSAGTMTAVDGWPYLPQGSYDISVRYTLVDGKVKTLTGTATSPAPTFPVSVDGYTSYNYGVGTGGYDQNVNTANGLDGSTVYGISSRIGVSSAVLSQLNYTSLTCSLDGTQVASASSGQSTSAVSRGSQSWNSHSITGSATFDGVTVTSSARTVYVTGLPWNDAVPASSGWDKVDYTSYISFNSSGIKFATWGGVPLARSKAAFYCPDNINIQISCFVSIYTAARGTYTKEVSMTVGSAKATMAGQNKTRATVTNTISATGSMENGSKVSLRQSSTAVGPTVTFSNINVRYN